MCRTRLGLAVFRVKNIFVESLPKREPLRADCVSSKSAISRPDQCVRTDGVHQSEKVVSNTRLATMGNVNEMPDRRRAASFQRESVCVNKTNPKRNRNNYQKNITTHTLRGFCHLNLSSLNAKRKILTRTTKTANLIVVSLLIRTHLPCMTFNYTSCGEG
jgi:hypothetical protein